MGQQTPEQTARYRVTQRAKHKVLIHEAKRKPCADCGVEYPPYVMDFDHNGSDKSFSIGVSIGRVSTQRLLDEIAKCDVVCANCHRERTYGPFDVS